MTMTHTGAGAGAQRRPSRSPLDPPFPPCGFAVGFLQAQEVGRLTSPPLCASTHVGSCSRPRNDSLGRRPPPPSGRLPVLHPRPCPAWTPSTYLRRSGPSREPIKLTPIIGPRSDEVQPGRGAAGFDVAQLDRLVTPRHRFLSACTRSPAPPSAPYPGRCQCRSVCDGPAPTAATTGEWATPRDRCWSSSTPPAWGDVLAGCPVQRGRWMISSVLACGQEGWTAP